MSASLHLCMCYSETLSFVTHSGSNRNARPIMPKKRHEAPAEEGQEEGLVSLHAICPTDGVCSSLDWTSLPGKEGIRLQTSLLTVSCNACMLNSPHSQQAGLNTNARMHEHPTLSLLHPPTMGMASAIVSGPTNLPAWWCAGKGWRKSERSTRTNTSEQPACWSQQQLHLLLLSSQRVPRTGCKFLFRKHNSHPSDFEFEELRLCKFKFELN